MLKFVATEDSYGANCRYYKKGQEYDFPEAPKDHFAPVGTPEAVKAAPAPVVTDHSVPMSYTVMTVAQLAEVAELKGVKINIKWSKDKIIQAILSEDTDILK